MKGACQTMEFKVQGNAEQLKVLVSGELIAQNCGELRDTIVELAEREPGMITIDLAGVTFVDSPGLGTLIGLRAQLRRQGTTLQLAHPQPRVMQVFRITQLHTLFEIIE